jgi:hypothetical protein
LVSASLRHPIPQMRFMASVEEKKAFCRCLRGMRVPTSFLSNIIKLVSMNDLFMFGYNSRDCHVMMMVFFSPSQYRPSNQYI